MHYMLNTIRNCGLDNFKNQNAAFTVNTFCEQIKKGRYLTRVLHYLCTLSNWNHSSTERSDTNWMRLLLFPSHAHSRNAFWDHQVQINTTRIYIYTWLLRLLECKISSILCMTQHLTGRREMRVAGDGNCFYRAIPLAIDGKSDSAHSRIRVLCNEIMAELFHYHFITSVSAVFILD